MYSGDGVPIVVSQIEGGGEKIRLLRSRHLIAVGAQDFVGGQDFEEGVEYFLLDGADTPTVCVTDPLLEL